MTAVLALGAIAILALPGGANAQAVAHGPASRSLKFKPKVVEAFAVRGTRGYEVGVEVLDRHNLEVVAAKRAAGIAGQSATYTVPYRQAPGSDEIKARIGHLGQVDVRFVPKSVKKETPPLPECEGGKTVVEKGYFVGLVSFRGERGYTRVRVRRAPGAVTRSPRLTCRFKSDRKHEKATKRTAERATPESEGELKTESVQLKAKADNGRVDLKAVLFRLRTKKESVALISFEATATRHLGAIKETSVAVTAFDKGSSFLLPDPLHPTSEAVIHPPSPFSGKAIFRRPPHGPPTWTGDLRVELPGLGVVRLAGKGTHAAMCEPVQCMGADR
jgi:hypothetical protein